MASGYVPILLSRAEGKRRWTIIFDQFFDDVLDAPTTLRETVIGINLPVNYRQRSDEDLVGILPSNAELEVLDDELFLFNHIWSARTLELSDREFRVRIESDDGVYRWRGFVRLDNVRRAYAYWIDRTVTNVHAYDGSGKIEELVKDVPFAFTSHGFVRSILHFGLHAIPIQYALAWRPDLATDPSDPWFDDFWFNRFELGLGFEWGDWLRDAIDRLNLRIWQGLNGDWNVFQWFLVGEGLDIYSGIAMRFEPPISVIGFGGIGELFPNNVQPNKVSFVERDGRIDDADLDIVGRIGDQVVGVEVADPSSESVRFFLSLTLDGGFKYWEPDLTPTLWQIVGTVAQDTRSLFGSFAPRIETGGALFQDTLFVRPGDDVFAGFRVWFAIEGGGSDTEVEFQVIAFPWDDSPAWYLQNDGVWSNNPLQVIATPSTTPDVLGAPTLTFTEFGFTGANPIPVPALLRFVCLGARAAASCGFVDGFKGFVADDEGNSEYSFEQYFFQFDPATKAPLAGKRLDLETRLPQASTVFETFFLETFFTEDSKQQIWIPSRSAFVPVRNWIYDDGTFSSDLGELVFADLVEFNGTAKRALIGRIDAILPPETVVVIQIKQEDGSLETVEFILAGGRVDLLRENTDGTWIEKPRKFVGVDPPEPVTLGPDAWYESGSVDFDVPQFVGVGAVAGAGFSGSIQLAFAAGRDAGAVLAKTDLYNRITGVFAPTTDKPTPVHGGAAVSTDQGLTVIGGFTTLDRSTPTAAREFLDGSNLSSFQFIDSIPAPRGDAGAGFLARVAGATVLLDFTFFVFGGFDGTSHRGEVYRKDVLALGYTQLSPMPEPVSRFAYATFAGEAYIFGGRTAGGVVATSRRYNGASDTWSPLQDLPFILERAKAITLGDRIYIFGGQDAAGTYRDLVFSYDPATDLYQALATMPTPRADVSLAAVVGMIFVVGGEDSGGSLDVVEVYVPFETSVALPDPGSLGFGRATSSSRVIHTGEARTVQSLPFTVSKTAPLPDDDRVDHQGSKRVTHTGDQRVSTKKRF